MIYIGIDPGPESSGYVLWDGQCAAHAGTDIDNSVLLRGTLPLEVVGLGARIDQTTLAIERIASYGAPVGDVIFETVFWSGRFAQWWEMTTGRAVVRLRFADVGLHHCLSRRAKESHIRQALLDRFGLPGTRQKPGPLYGVHGHAWSALALAVAVFDQHLAAAATIVQEPVIHQEVS